MKNVGRAVLALKNRPRSRTGPRPKDRVGLKPQSIDYLWIQKLQQKRSVWCHFKADQQDSLSCMQILLSIWKTKVQAKKSESFSTVGTLKRPKWFWCFIPWHGIMTVDSNTSFWNYFAHSPRETELQIALILFLIFYEASAKKNWKKSFNAQTVIQSFVLQLNRNQISNGMILNNFSYNRHLSLFWPISKWHIRAALLRYLVRRGVV